MEMGRVSDWIGELRVIPMGSYSHTRYVLVISLLHFNIILKILVLLLKDIYLLRARFDLDAIRVVFKENHLNVIGVLPPL